jgi:hypothetical protein
MPKLTTRQIIILIVMAIAILYAAYDFLIASRAKKDMVDTGKKITELEAFMAEVTANMPKGSLSASDAYKINRAEAEWMRDPFFERKSFREWVKSKEPAKTGGGTGQKMIFHYSGYLKVKDKKIAIINGVEYEPGESLEIEGYVLKSIYQDKVVILNQKNGAKLDVPLQE